MTDIPTREQPAHRHAMLDVWLALKLPANEFERWIDHPKRTPADAWAVLLAAIRGDDLTVDTNPPAGVLADWVVTKGRGSLFDRAWEAVGPFVVGEQQRLLAAMALHTAVGGTR